MKNRLILVAVLLACFVAEPIGANTYFVRKGGSDAANGLTWGTAWASWAKVQSTVVVGDTTVWGAGRWDTVRIVPPSGGSNTNWTEYICSTYYTGTTAAEKLAGKYLTIWNGGAPVTGWTVHSGSVYKAYAPIQKPKPGVTQYAAAKQGKGSHDCDSMLVPQNQLSWVDQAGTFRHQNDTMYVWPYHGALASTDTIWCAAGVPCFVDNSGTNHVRFWGLQIELGHQSSAGIFQGNCDSLFWEHCKLRMGGRYQGNNAAAFYTEGDQTGCDHNYIRSSDLSWGVCSPDANSSTQAPDQGFWHNGGGATIYSQNHFVFDSCTFSGFGAAGFYFKLSKDETSPWDGCVVRYSTIDGTNMRSTSASPLGGGVVFIYFDGRDSVYGNTFINCVYGIVKWWDSNSGAFLSGNQCWFTNNTFYNTERMDVMLKREGDSGPLGSVNDGPVTIKYNASYRSTMSVGADQVGFVGFRQVYPQAYYDTTKIDSNIWHVPTTSNWRMWNGSQITWTNWRAGSAGGKTYDINSSQADPGFSNAPAGDFSRPGASGEMNLTYGGKTWTKFGAIQGTPGNFCPTITQNLPSNGGSIASTTATLDFDLFDTDGELQVVEVYLERGDPTPDVKVLDTTVTADDDVVRAFSGLTEDSVYYWQIVTTDTAGCVTTSPIWSFLVDATNNCPVVSPVTPLDAQQVSVLPLTLRRDVTDFNSDNVIVKMYGGTTNPPTTLLRTDTVSAPELNHPYVWNGLSNLTTYFWRDSVIDIPGGCRVGGTIRSFTTDTVTAAPTFKVRGHIRGKIR